jgi:glutamate-1-semialdehyde aminotransferase
VGSPIQSKSLRLEAAFVSLAHDDAVIAATLQAAEEALEG